MLSEYKSAFDIFKEIFEAGQSRKYSSYEEWANTMVGEDRTIASKLLYTIIHLFRQH